MLETQRWAGQAGGGLEPVAEIGPRLAVACPAKDGYVVGTGPEGYPGFAAIR